jgi:hypothetical protein
MKYIKESSEWQATTEVEQFCQFCWNRLKWSTRPVIIVTDDHAEAGSVKSMGSFNRRTGEIRVLRGARLTADWYRTLAHELVHHAQRDSGQTLDGADGSTIENEANSQAAVILREYGRLNPQIFQK